MDRVLFIVTKKKFRVRYYFWGLSKKLLHPVEEKFSISNPS